MNLLILMSEERKKQEKATINLAKISLLTSFSIKEWFGWNVQTIEFAKTKR